MTNSRPKVKMNSAGAKALLMSDEIQEDLLARATRIANAAGDGFEPNVTIGRTRALASVVAVTEEARAAEAEARVLTSALDAGR